MSVTAAAGFRAAGVTAGLKPSGRPDLALVVNDGPGSAAAGVFTTNTVQAAPVLWSRQVLRGGRLRAVVLNSGGANACTGAAGFADTHTTAESLAAALDVSAGEVAVCSTGLIGVRLPMDLLLAGLADAVRGLDRGGQAAEEAAAAICTTDTVTKQAVRATPAYTVGGMAKGAGMLAPALATMLVVLTTDADLAAVELDRALRSAVAGTFERVDTDGCLSTNDTVLLMASAASGHTPSTEELTATLTETCADLAEQLVDDAEGATKRITVAVSGAVTEDEALSAARAVARSALVKCAIHGQDPNWGRVLAAVGTAPARFDPLGVDVSFNGQPVCRAGVAAGEPAAARRALAPREVAVQVDLHAGGASAAVLTTDLTAAYVHENSAYST